MGDKMDNRDDWPVKPRIVCSRCLGFDHCRYNGLMIRNQVVDALRPHVEFVTPCPEVETGLGVPRRPIRIILKDSRKELYQPATGEHWTEGMLEYTQSFFSSLGPVDGFIMKSRSPSCGILDAKFYTSEDKPGTAGRGAGLFGERVLRDYSSLAVEDDGRLHNPKIRDHFFTKLFTLASFRIVEENGKASDLVEFHSRYKLLLMSYNQSEMRSMGRTVADQKETGLKNAMQNYRQHLEKALHRGRTYRNNINTLQHAFGYVSESLSGDERKFFLDNLEMYREARTPLKTCLDLLRSWILRFNVEYLSDQTFFQPYPEDLNEKFDTYRMKDYWKNMGTE
ncbi:MAG: DUF1722 domain-containing protein [Candidatus Aegiribacteria sp.]|nr:DUF1722 domain-containing protein [Candidatus Aegiribacteria sp.]MBD3295139.1 DUF1722 domain-containing protein [Candidatus Fermentibacteria bacterium]